MPVIARSSTGLSGEYFVAAELYRRGWLVGITVGNAKAIDILAEKEGTNISIQVKAIYKKKNVGWPLMTDKIQDGCYYVFVNLNADKMSMPDYFIATSDEVRVKIKQYATRGIVNLSLLNTPDFQDNWGKLG